jgi:hypothetical protein
LIGIDLAVKVVQRLLSPSGGVVLEVCRALWVLQGLFEKSNYETFQSMYTQFNSEHERMELELDARLSVAATGMSDTVVLMNDRERHIFQHQACQKQQQIVNQSAWSFRQLLYLQQVVLSKLDVPGFEDGATVDVESLQLQSYVCQYLHSAFYIRNRMGREPHESMLRSQLKKLLREQEQQQTGGQSPKMNSQSIRTSSPMIRYSPIPPTMQQQQQQQYNNANTNATAPMIPQMSAQLYNKSYQQQQQQLAYPQQLYQPPLIPGNTMVYSTQSSMMTMTSQPVQQQQYIQSLAPGTYYNDNQMLLQQSQQHYLSPPISTQQLLHPPPLPSSSSSSLPQQYGNGGLQPPYQPYYQQ